MQNNIVWGETVAIDFETPYKKDTNKKAKDGINIDSLGSWAYVRHEWVVPYLVSVYDGISTWVGDPLEFNWKGLENRTLLAHNASFDEDVLLANIELGRFPTFEYKEFICTADISTWATGFRNLKDATKELFGIEISKEARTNAEGKVKADMIADGSWEGMVKYAADDAVHCFNIWKKCHSKWPERERKISRLNRNAGRKGIRIDVSELNRGIKLCQHVLAESVELLPWVKRGRKEGSSIGVAEECRISNIPPPPVKSGPDGDLEAAEEWLEKYAATQPWVKALKDIRRGKKMLATLETIKRRLRADDTVPFSLLYWGTHTGRFAGVGGLNILNLNKEPLFPEWDYEFKRGIDVRGLFIAREGKRFAVVDLSQIEPRCLNWAVGNEALLSRIRGGMAIYEAFARVAMGWTGGTLKKEDKYLYALAKAQCVAEGTLVLTEHGYQRIESIEKSTKVWDGVEFVSHDGILLKGGRPVIPVGFEYFTEDHEIFTNDESTRYAGVLCKGPEAAQRFRHASSAGWTEVWALGIAVLRAYTSWGLSACFLSLRNMRKKRGR